MRGGAPKYSIKKIGKGFSGRRKIRAGTISKVNIMVNVAVLGFGTVGSGVVELIEMNKVHIAQKLEQELNVKYILDIRSFPDSPYADKFVKDFSIIENDPEIKVVAEVIGGCSFAYDYTVRALKAGKSVVTSNKELVAAKGVELLNLAKKHNVNYFFEASVGGGIPIIRPMHRCMAANEITEVYGILNGTTNYILTKMIEEKVPFEKALAQAQELGYAEANPAADIEGADACRKICILASLAFGHHVYPENVRTVGITNINRVDVAIADEAGYAVKLICQAKYINGKYRISVSPALVDKNTLLSRVRDVFNAVLIKGNAVGDIFLSGRGAGKLPTASAVVADILDAAKHFEFLKGWGWQDELPDEVLPFEECEDAWYLRAENCREDILEVYPEARFICDDDDIVYAFSHEKEHGNAVAFFVPHDKNAEHIKKQAKLNVLAAIPVLEV